MAEPNGSQGDDISQLLMLLQRLNHSLRRDHVRLQASDPAVADGSPLPNQGGQFRLLVTLMRHGELTTQGLADAMEVSAPTVSAMTRRLREQGFVAQRRDAHDQRVVWHSFTDAGREALQAKRRFWREAFEQRFNQLSADDQEHIRQAIPAFERLLSTDLTTCPGKDA